MRFVDCNGLAGHATLGVIQAGGTLLHRCGTLKLGAENMRANRPLTGWSWEDEFSDNPTDWHVPDDVDLVIGTPPCSGYSTMTRADLRGVDAKVNFHMNSLVAYAARVAPPFVAFESVQQAYTTGRTHMVLLRDKLEADTGHQYNLYHVKHNNAVLGGAAQRKRYWWVASRVPFGMDPPVPQRVPTLLESIGDLRGLQSTWEKQPYVYPETWWSSRRRSADGAVDGHAIRRLTHERRVRALLNALDGYWPQGWRESDACRAVYEKYGRLPDEWSAQEARLVGRKFDMGINQMIRWRADQPARVLTGAALDQAMHPTELRMFTLREAMRIQGWPDTWRLWPSRNVASHPLWPGKGAPVDAARWLGVWVKEALEGRPGSMRGTPVGDREFLLDSTHNYKLAPYELGRRHPAR
jgi:site-specific DNA-cytosine methylase